MSGCPCVRPGGVQMLIRLFCRRFPKKCRDVLLFEAPS